MAIPSFQDLMLPMLKLLADGREWKLANVIEALATEFNLSPQERREKLESGPPKFDNRVAWAHTYLKAAGLVEAPRGQRGVVKITQHGRDVLAENPERIDIG